VLPQTATAKDHSPLGFEWGYGGSGPHALANAILAYELSDVLGKEGAEQVADDLDTAFKEAKSFPDCHGLPAAPLTCRNGNCWAQRSAVGNRITSRNITMGKLENIHPAWHVVELDEIWNQ
jgi:hypothetical protein